MFTVKIRAHKLVKRHGYNDKFTVKFVNHRNANEGINELFANFQPT